jgi:hypothetical protein
VVLAYDFPGIIANGTQEQRTGIQDVACWRKADGCTGLIDTVQFGLQALNLRTFVLKSAREFLLRNNIFRYLQAKRDNYWWIADQLRSRHKSDQFL